MKLKEANQEIQWQCSALYCDARINNSKQTGSIACNGKFKVGCAIHRLNAMHLTCSATKVEPFQADLKLQCEISRIVAQYLSGQLQ